VTDQIVITEKTSQAKDVRSAVGNRFRAILPVKAIYACLYAAAVACR
jgi:hypothetical protein